MVKDPATGLWSEIGHKKAVEKTSQALRDGAASLRKQLSADLHDPDFISAVFDVDPDLEESSKKTKSPKSKSTTGKIALGGVENNKGAGKKQSQLAKKVRTETRNVDTSLDMPLTVMYATLRFRQNLL